MNNTQLVNRGLINAGGTVAYVALVAILMSNVERLFAGREDTVAAPIAFLLLFVTSAAITAGLVLGKPLMLYLDNQKPAAVKLFGYTVGWLFVFTIIALAANWLF